MSLWISGDWQADTVSADKPTQSTEGAALAGNDADAGRVALAVSAAETRPS